MTINTLKNDSNKIYENNSSYQDITFTQLCHKTFSLICCWPHYFFFPEMRTNNFTHSLNVPIKSCSYRGVSNTGKDCFFSALPIDSPLTVRGKSPVNRIQLITNFPSIFHALHWITVRLNLSYLCKNFL